MYNKTPEYAHRSKATAIQISIVQTFPFPELTVSCSAILMLAYIKSNQINGSFKVFENCGCLPGC